MAEITAQDAFGRAMEKCIRKYAIKKILEIGAFDGDGSTQVLARALTAKNGEKILVSLEEQAERFQNLVANTTSYHFAQAVQMSSIGRSSFTARNFDKDVWNSSFNGLCYPKKQVEEWHAEDSARISHIANGFLECSDESWDAVLIDGGEFFGWDEFRLLRSRSRCFFLDDAFHAFKTFRVRVELSRDPDWRLVWADANVRNGAAIYVHRSLPRESRLFSALRFFDKICGRDAGW